MRDEVVRAGVGVPECGLNCRGSNKLGLAPSARRNLRCETVERRTLIFIVPTSEKSRIEQWLGEKRKRPASAK